MVQLFSKSANQLFKAFRNPLRVLLVCTGLLLSSAYAQAKLELSSPAIWLESAASEVTILTASGDVFSFDGATLTRLDSGFQGDSLVACNDGFIGIKDGFIRYAGKEGFSPEVALQARASCLANGKIAALASNAKTLYVLDENLNILTEVFVNALPDAEIIATDLNNDSKEELILLTTPSSRYQHGVLGDAIEAESLTVFDSETLAELATYSLDEPFVFEQRRVTPFSSANRVGILATTASGSTGAGVLFLEWIDDTLEATAQSDFIGTGFRWLNLFSSQEGSAFAIRTPHIGGPLQRYTLEENELLINAFQLSVTNHVIRSRNLDLAVMLPSSSSEKQFFAFPDQSLTSIKLIVCEANCEVQKEYALESRLSTNLSYLETAEDLTVLAADESGGLYAFLVELE